MQYLNAHFAYYYTKPENLFPARVFEVTSTNKRDNSSENNSVVVFSFASNE